MNPLIQFKTTRLPLLTALVLAGFAISPPAQGVSPAPVAELKLPVLTLRSDDQPTAVLAEPVVRLKRALAPSAVVKLG